MIGYGDLITALLALVALAALRARLQGAIALVWVTVIVGMLDTLNAPLHDLSLGASHLLYERATERNQAVRQQSILGVALTAFPWAPIWSV